jgi:hypothetical protein
MQVPVESRVCRIANRGADNKNRRRTCPVVELAVQIVTIKNTEEILSTIM